MREKHIIMAVAGMVLACVAIVQLIPWEGSGYIGLISIMVGLPLSATAFYQGRKHDVQSSWAISGLVLNGMCFLIIMAGLIATLLLGSYIGMTGVVIIDAILVFIVIAFVLGIGVAVSNLGD